jgi:hypothetical protein
LFEVPRLYCFELNLFFRFGGIAVADPFPTRVSAALAQKGHGLAVQREAYYRELLESGRWRHYGTEADIKAKLAEAEVELKRWQTILAAQEKEKPQVREEYEEE